MSSHELEEAARDRGWDVVHHYDIYRIGWETDNEGILARDCDGAMHVITTSHGGLRVDKDLGEGESIHELRDQARAWLKQMETAVELVVTDHRRG